MGKINIEDIWKKNFNDQKLIQVEESARIIASENTDECIEKYRQLERSRKGKYISSDLMKFVFPDYAKSVENRRIYNLSISNSAACLANEMFRREMEKPENVRCIFVAGAYGAGKSFFVQSLFEEVKENLEGTVIYEGSITSKAIDGKTDYAIEHNVVPNMIVLNPTLELSLRNIKERANRIGRDVRKEDCIFVYAHIYDSLKRLTSKYPSINFAIYNKSSNIPINLSVSSSIEDLNHGKLEQISNEYDNIKEKLLNEDISNLEKGEK